MAKDDYFVIVYQVLEYLYECLKKGEAPDIERLSYQNNALDEKYWTYIFKNMSKQGFITGVIEVVSLDGSGVKLQDVQITPKGIEYLFDNSLIQKAKRAMKDIKGAIPGI